MGGAENASALTHSVEQEKKQVGGFSLEKNIGLTKKEKKPKKDLALSANSVGGFEL
jgi:hypothetical protein